MAGPMVGPLLESLGLELVETYWTPNGKFPDHEPNPLLPENRQFIIEKVREEGADLGIAWDGDADRCFFIDETGEFVDGDFLTALLAESLLRKSEKPGEAILYDVRASRAVPDTVTPRGRRARDQPRRPRLLQDADAQGGLAVRRRGLRPLLLPRLLLRGLGHDPGAAGARDARDRTARACPSCSRRTASATSSPARSTPRSPTREAKMSEIAERYADAEQGHLDGISIDYEDWHFNVRPSNTEPLLRLCLESLVSARGHGAPPRRGARRDPLVSDGDGELQERAAGPRTGRRGGHPPPRDADAVHGRPRQRLPDRGLAADAGRLGAELGEGAGRARAGAGRARPPRRGHRAAGDQPPAHGPLRPRLDPRAALRRRGRGARAAGAPTSRPTDSETDLDDAFAEGIMLRHGIPPEIVTALRAVSAGFRAWGSAVEVDATAARRRGAGAARPHAAGAAPPGPQPVGHRVLRRAALDPAVRRPPDRAHLLEPAAGAAARRGARPGRAAPAGADHLHALAGSDPGDAGRPRAAGPRPADHRPRGADRRALPHAPAARGEDPRTDRRAAAHARTRSPRSCGATSP